MKLAMVVAVGNQGQIGKDNQLLWHIPEDLKKFKALTMGGNLIMGRKTFDSIGRVLPGRTSVVLTRDKSFKGPEGLVVFHSIEEVLEFVKGNSKESYIIGGGEIYKLFLPYVSDLYYSQVDYSGDADVVFDEVDLAQWKVESLEEYMATEKSPAWTFKHLTK